jgi:hypothetical protein
MARTHSTQKNGGDGEDNPIREGIASGRGQGVTPCKIRGRERMEGMETIIVTRRMRARSYGVRGFDAASCVGCNYPLHPLHPLRPSASH